MITLTISEVAELHEKLITATGGSYGIRDAGLLDSAVLGCDQSFDGTDLYPSIVEKAARTAYAVCKNHPFIDGNKRTAVTSMLVMLRLKTRTCRSRVWNRKWKYRIRRNCILAQTI